MIQWPENLIHDVARRRCVAFLGSGISRRSQDASGRRPALWKGLLETASGNCANPTAEINRLLKAGDYLTACQLIKERLGEHDWHDILEKEFHTPAYGHDEIHQAIFDLDLPIVATTNIDQIYDKFLTSNYAGATTIKPYHDDSVGRYIKGDANTRLLIKVHVSVDNLDKTVFTREQYARARSAYPEFYSLLSSLIDTQTFLFLGYSLADPDINVLLEDNARRFKSPRPHYLITSDRVSNDMIKMFSRNYSIKVLRYSNTKEHQELVESIDELAKKVAIERNEMAARMVW